MSYDLGDPVALAINVTDADGDLADAGSMALTITLPDGTTTTSPITHTETGKYAATFLPTVPGRHMVRWLASGANSSAHVDVFDVRDASPPYVVSLADVRSHLNLTPTDTQDDDELRRYIEAAGEVIDGICGPVAVRTVVERQTSGRFLYPRTTPVVEIISVEPWRNAGTTYSAADVTVSPTGRVELLSGGWFVGGPFKLTYTAGRTFIPATITEAALELIRINYRSHTGAQDFRYERGDSAEYTPETSPLDLGFFIPNGIYALLRPYAQSVHAL